MNLADLISYLIECAIELIQATIWFTALITILMFVIETLGGM